MHIAFSKKRLSQYLRRPQNIIRVAEDEAGFIAGFAMAEIEPNGSAHILTLDVVPEARRKRIGTALMKDMHRQLRSRRIAVSFLEVGVGNVAAQELYKKLKYRYLDTLIGYYGREDAFLMGRALSNNN